MNKPLSSALMQKMDAYWRAANYLSVGQIYLYVHGFKEEGTTTTPFDMVVLNELDRFHLAKAAIDRVPGLGPGAAKLAQFIDDKLIEHQRYIRQHGEDMPEIRNWKWGANGANAENTLRK